MNKYIALLVSFACLALLSTPVSASFVEFVSPTPQNGDPISNSLTIRMNMESPSTGTFIDWDRSLAGWWNFENAYEDKSTYHHETSCSECPELVEGIHGHAYDFDGYRDHIKVERIPNLNLGPNLTISMWVNLKQKPDVDTTTLQDQYHNLIDQFDPGGYLLRVRENGRLVSYPRRDGDGYYISADSGYTLSWGNTYHIVFQIEETDPSHSTIHYYVNGQHIRDVPLSYHVGGTNRYIYIGAWGRSEHRSTYGLIDDVMLFKRVLSPQEISELYNSGTSFEAQFSCKENKDYSFYGCATDSQGVSHCTETRGLSNGMPPAISNVHINEITSTSANISWTTDQPSQSIIEFGPDQNYGYTKQDSGFRTQHSLVIDKLRRGTSYHFRIVSKDISGDSAFSPDYTFTTQPELDIIPQPQHIASKGFYVSLNGWRIETHKFERYMFSATWLQERMHTPLPITTITPASTHRILLGDVDSPYIKKHLHDRNIVFPSGMPDEGYVLEVFPDEIIIVSSSPKGIFYGVQTLLQVLKYDDSVEAVSVTDWPDNRIRGVVVSRHDSPLYIGQYNSSPVFTQEQKDYIDKLAHWKMNMVVLFERDGYTWQSDPKYIQPYVEMKNYMKERFMDFVPVVAALKDFRHVPFYLGDGWYVQDEEFYFGSDNKAYAVNPMQNLISNSGFESGTTDGWLVVGDAEVTSEDKHSGQYSLRMKKGYISMTFPVKPGEIYQLVTSAKGAYPKICIFAKDESDNTLYTSCDYTKTVPVTYWRTFAATIRANNDTKRIMIRIYPMHGYQNYTYFDDIMFFRLNGGLKNVIRTETTDIVVTNLDKTITYKEGIDYRIIDGQTKKTFSWDLQPFVIERIPGGSIAENQHVLVSYDFITFYKLTSAESIPLCISDDRLFTEYYYPAIERIIRYIKPKILMFRGDETRGFNRDSRDIRSGLTNAEQYAKWVNNLNSYVKSQDPNARIMIWDDMISPYHNGGVDYQLSYGGPAGKIADILKNNLISNDVIMDIWWYGDEYLTQMHKSTELFASRGFDYVGSPWYNLQNIKSWSEILVDRAQSLGGLDTDWGIGNIDEHYPYFADHIWNTRYKVIYFSSFETDENNDNVPDGWTFEGDMQTDAPNLISNPSFERGFENWTVIYSDEGTPDISSDSYDGTKSVHFKSNSDYSSGITTSYYISVIPNKRYVWSGCGKTYNVTVGREGYHKLYGTGRFLNDSYQRPYADNRYFLDISFNAGTHDWQCVSYEKRAPEDAAYFKIGSIGILNTGKGEGWIDKLSFKQYVPPFYSCDKNNMQGHQYANKSKCAICLNGSQSVRSKPIPITSQKEYTLSVYVKKEDIVNTPCKPKISIEWYDYQNQYISSSELELDGVGNDYVLSELKTVSPRYARYAVIKLQGGGDQFFWFDTVRLKEKFDRFPSCGNSVCEYPENRRNCAEDCIPKADDDKNGRVETREMLAFIRKWFNPEEDILSLKDIIKSIKAWKGE